MNFFFTAHGNGLCSAISVPTLFIGSKNIGRALQNGVGIQHCALRVFVFDTQAVQFIAIATHGGIHCIQSSGISCGGATLRLQSFIERRCTNCSKWQALLQRLNFFVDLDQCINIGAFVAFTRKQAKDEINALVHRIHGRQCRCRYTSDQRNTPNYQRALAVAFETFPCVFGLVPSNCCTGTNSRSRFFLPCLEILQGLGRDFQRIGIDLELRQ